MSAQAAHVTHAVQPGATESRARADPSSRRVLVLGGSSEIAIAIVRALAARSPCTAALLGRDAQKLGDAAKQLRAAGCARAVPLELDAHARERHGETLERAFAELGGVDLAILAVGVLGERGGMPSDIGSALEVLDVNTLGAGSLLLHTARRMREAGGGTIVVLSSVAAERARRANAVYGASKAGLDALACGLGDDLHDSGVRVLVVRPGFVRTRMTEGLRPAPLATTPDGVAKAVLRGLDGGAQVVWAPASLRWLMLALRTLPRPLFRRLDR
jgi:decaprenylphospho-beta-D-erythro-pentofuranosid-2-ulose 2-reductase